MSSSLSGAPTIHILELQFHHPLAPDEWGSLETQRTRGKMYYGESAEGPVKCTGEIPILHKFSGLRLQIFKKGAGVLSTSEASSGADKTFLSR
jgi:hypothetical protein